MQTRVALARRARVAGWAVPRQPERRKKGGPGWSRPLRCYASGEKRLLLVGGLGLHDLGEQVVQGAKVFVDDVAAGVGGGVVACAAN